ncbi:hypothetical protein JOF56_009201 [Kibdelosporangium banguiense]|uniref:Uncharacterized protein n=1 Tax=Kibdelosporangium banguiense TaxID=1365924 RepID=A0ABS4TWL9_9PSEU|nr:hypothetical protein [Kibdelosporangium banguiense]MBP2328816.1 hypothetical protein [Kibdelosporangium banguiense]
MMLGKGGQTISDLAALPDQPALFGAVASTAIAWRVLDSIDTIVLQRLRAARAVARERADYSEQRRRADLWRVLVENAAIRFDLGDRGIR